MVERANPALPDPHRTPDAELRLRVEFDDARLLAECDVHIYRASGPGGQHRNKVSSAIRLRHRPSDITVTATERRSQHENKAKALGRLRAALALYARAPMPDQITWPATVQIRDGRLRVSEKNPALHQVIGLVLDALYAANGQTKDAAACLAITTSSLAKFLAAHPKAWAEANRIREQAGLRPLRREK